MITCPRCLTLYDALFRAEADRRNRTRNRASRFSPHDRANVAALRALRGRIDGVRALLDEHLGRHR